MALTSSSSNSRSSNNHYTLANRLTWDYHLLLSTQHVLHFIAQHATDDTINPSTRRILLMTTEYYGHRLLTTTQNKNNRATHTPATTRTLQQLQVTRPICPNKDFDRMRESGQLLTTDRLPQPSNYNPGASSNEATAKELQAGTFCLNILDYIIRATQFDY